MSESTTDGARVPLTPRKRKQANDKMAHIEAQICALDAQIEAAPRSTESDAVFERAQLLSERAAINVLLKAKS